MKNNKETVRLLILDTSQNEAEDLVNLLRNAGRATQAELIESEQHLNELTSSKTWDICFANNRSTEFTPLQLQAYLKKHEQDIPVLMIDESGNSELMLAALEAGIRDVIPANEPNRLLLVALRELENLYVRRAHRKAEIGLRDAEKRCRLLLDSSKDAIAYVHDGMHIYANQAYVKLFGYPDFDELEGMPLMDMVSSESQGELKTFLRDFSSDNDENDNIDCKGVRFDDSEFDTHMEFSLARYDGEACTQIIIRTSHDTMAHAAQSKDILTGLENQESLLQHLDKAIQKAVESSQKSAVLYIKLDDFVPIKNRLGLSGTNLLLGDIAKTLATKVKAPDLLARVDDYSFAALTHDPESSMELGKSLCETLANNEFDVSDQRLNVTASIGISLINENTTDAKEIIEKSENAANFSKRESGSGNGVHMHSSEEQSAAQNDKVINLLKTALEKELFKQVYQPIVSLRGDTGEHYEMLLRIPDEIGNDICPSEFLQVASSQGITKDIDRWVIQKSIANIKKHLDKGHKTHIFINITLESLLDTSLLPWLSAQLNDARMPGDSIIFQISEKDATSHLSATKEFIKGVNQLECKAALTHFGRALNPFATLKSLPVSFVKIDSSFITEITKSDEAKEELKTLISSLHTQGKLTIAPLVDSASLLPVLWQAGINYIQGYYIQQPSEKMDYDFSTEDHDA